MQPLSQVLPPSARTTPEGHLSVGGCDVVALAEEFGTPLVIYDGGLLRDTMRRYVSAFRAHDAQAEVIYASKAFWAQALLRMAHEEGLRVDVASGGELFMALHAGFPAEKIVMHGNAKDARELGEALDAMVGLVVVDEFGIQVTEKGWFFVRAVAMVFDRYLQTDRTRAKFSKII